MVMPWKRQFHLNFATVETTEPERWASDAAQDGHWVDVASSPRRDLSGQQSNGSEKYHRG